MLSPRAVLTLIAALSLAAGQLAHAEHGPDRPAGHPAPAGVGGGSLPEVAIAADGSGGSAAGAAGRGSGAGPERPAPAALELLVLCGGLPCAGVQVSFQGAQLGITDDDGALQASLPTTPGELRLRRGGDEALAHPLRAGAGEQIQLIVQLRAGESPRVDISRSGSEDATAKAQGGLKKARDVRPPGALRGEVYNLEGAPVAGASVYFTGVERAVKTDAQGRFLVELPAGPYAVSVVHPGFAPQTLDRLQVVSGREASVRLELSPAGVAMEDYVITAPYVEGSVAAAQEQQRAASSVSELLGAEQLSATGDSDAAAALGRVSGLTIDQGKYVLVRGQPYRYTFTTWNGSPLPSPEPLLRVVPLDLFPTGVLAGIEVQKSFTPDKPGEFGAGLINLKTRGIPERAFVSVKLSTGLNSASSFRTGQRFGGGRWDWLGYDDGSRALPEPVARASNGGKTDLDDLPESTQTALGQSFANRYRLRDASLPPDAGAAVAGGGSLDLPGEGRIGAVASLQWDNKWRRQRRLQRRFALSDGRLVRRDDFVQRRTDRRVNLSGLLTVTAEWEGHSLSSNTFYAHQTQQRAELKQGYLGRSVKGDLRSYTLTWLERQLIAEQLIGHHALGWLEIDYRAGLAAADRDAPDRREYAYLAEDTGDAEYYLFGNGVSREFDEVGDRIKSFGLDLSFILSDPERAWLGAKLKLGGAIQAQDRDTTRRIFAFNPDDDAGADLRQTDPERLFDPALTGDRLKFEDFSASDRDDSTGYLDVLAGYLMADLRLGGWLRLVGGARYEAAVMQVITYRLEPVIRPGSSQAVKGRFTQAELLPALSATWYLQEDLQVKAAYARTTSRPNLNELSNARFYDPDSGEGFVGNPQLKPAIIDGADLRAEWYPSGTESLALGGFYKRYTDPIERTFQRVSGTDPLGSYQNAQGARVLGLELSGRLELARLGEAWDLPEFVDHLYLMGNASVMRSRVELGAGGINTTQQRPLDGQAAYALNLQAGFSGEDHDVNLAFRQVGRRLHRAGIQGQPDIFLDPVGTLDFSWRWKVWDGPGSEGGLRLKGGNLLNPQLVWRQGGEVWRALRRGLSVGLSFEVKHR